MNKFLSLIISALFLLSACGGGSDSGSKSDADTVVAIKTVEGSLSTDNFIIINGSGFTEKANAKPLFWWKADFGEVPSELGRKTAWDLNTGVSFFDNNTLSTSVIASGSQQSVSIDHGRTSGAALGAIYFDSNELYVHRKTYEDFDILKDMSFASYVAVISGTLNVGDVVTGSTSGATAVIRSIRDNPSPTTTHLIVFEDIGGTIHETSPVDFIKGEQVVSDSGAVMTQDFLRKTFNFKTMRMWTTFAQLDIINDVHVAAQGSDGNNIFRITPEYSQNTIWGGSFTNQALAQLPREWKVDEFYYRASNIDVADGIFGFAQKGLLGTESNFISKTTERPNPYVSLYQSQVSNGAKLGSNMYYDSLYVDDTWHRVLICPEATWNIRSNCEVQIPTNWNDSQVTVQVNLGGLDTNKPMYLYVIDRNGVANLNGWMLTP